ncbi:hypothetical protein RCL1_007787 [Eukaryota sp. TZLM3-RCL]
MLRYKQYPYRFNSSGPQPFANVDPRSLTTPSPKPIQLPLWKSSALFVPPRCPSSLSSSPISSPIQRHHNTSPSPPPSASFSPLFIPNTGSIELSGVSPSKINQTSSPSISTPLSSVRLPSIQRSVTFSPPRRLRLELSTVHSLR